MSRAQTLLDASARAIAVAVRAREVSAVEVTEAALARAQERGPAVGAFVVTTPDLALAQAEQVDRDVVERDADALPLAGVPVPIKDLNQVAGVAMSAGARVLASSPMVPEVDDGVVTRLRAAGATMIGKTTTPEFGFPPYTEPRIGPGGAVLAARTPWDLRRGAGGSSGGAAAAVAAGIVPIAHASDGGGSVRIPAASCGLVGIKPSRGVISSGPYGVDGPGLATHGVIARNVLDAALGLSVLAGGWPGDVVGMPDGVRPAELLARLAREEGQGAAGLRVGLLLDPVVADDAEVHPAARAAAERAARALDRAGCHVEPAPVPFTAQEWMAFMPLWATTAAMLPVPPEAVGLLEPLTQWLRELGLAVTGPQYATAVADAQRVARQVGARWGEFDVVITPSLAQPPAPVGSWPADPAENFAEQKRFTPWTSIANIAGLPSVTVPIHRERVDGVELPFGAILTGRLGQDEGVLRLARVLELADPWPAPPGPDGSPSAGSSGG